MLPPLSPLNSYKSLRPLQVTFKIFQFNDKYPGSDALKRHARDVMAEVSTATTDINTHHQPVGEI